jgi:hypothetical protein
MNTLKPVTMRPVVKQDRPTSSTVTRRLNPDYTEKWRYPLGNSAEAQTVPTRCCTEVFFSASQGRHGDMPAATGGDPYDV